MSQQLPSTPFFTEVRQILNQARTQVAQTVNTAMVEAYWQIGKRIVEEEQGGSAQAEYGSGLLKELSKQLNKEFGKGFSYANLRNFRQFYLIYPDGSNCYALRSNLSWTHHRSIMRVDDAAARAYYIEQCSRENWSTRTLERQIQPHTYQRLLSTKKSTEDSENNTLSTQSSALNILKDPYVLEFLKLPEEPSLQERELETALINDLQKFLLELGGGFSFVARQMRISTETSHFYLDLVFYNYLLKCFVVVDLKTTKLTHQDIGQMDMYVRMFDDLKRGEDDNPTIGIILCADKDETMVQYSVLKESEQLFASKYRTILPSEEELIAELERERRLLE
ncbi:PDDEXK nuclease domain-containing protein [Rubritalea marina]|uniref:PDDEXK nuclease domain-containing protein n=1 Tax=Rubritalea marina TaxID=361055 RepID=UPI00037D8C5E|nr:PDDEXK nuclease domain-containing protein [Rubritalea marina]